MKTQCAVCGREIEVTEEEFKKNTEPLCEYHQEEEEVQHG